MEHLYQEYSKQKKTKMEISNKKSITAGCSIIKFGPAIRNQYLIFVNPPTVNSKKDAA
jgi:hypothetical protein